MSLTVFEKAQAKFLRDTLGLVAEFVSNNSEVVSNLDKDELYEKFVDLLKIPDVKKRASPSPKNKERVLNYEDFCKMYKDQNICAFAWTRGTVKRNMFCAADIGEEGHVDETDRLKSRCRVCKKKKSEGNAVKIFGEHSKKGLSAKVVNNDARDYLSSNKSAVTPSATFKKSPTGSAGSAKSVENSPKPIKYRVHPSLKNLKKGDTFTDKIIDSDIFGAQVVFRKKDGGKLTAIGKFAKSLEDDEVLPDDYDKMILPLTDKEKDAVLARNLKYEPLEAVVKDSDNDNDSDDEEKQEEEKQEEEKKDDSSSSSDSDDEDFLKNVKK